MPRIFGFNETVVNKYGRPPRAAKGVWSRVSRSRSTALSQGISYEVALARLGSALGYGNGEMAAIMGKPLEPGFGPPQMRWWTIGGGPELGEIRY